MSQKQILWTKEIEAIENSGYLKKDVSVTDALIENFYNEIMNREEKKLMKLVFSSEPLQDELDDLLKVWDIEVKNSAKTLILAYFMKSHPKLRFTRYEEPRLNGLLMNFRFKNLQTVAFYSKVARVLNNENITPLLLKDALMRHLRPEFPRAMDEVDILVPKKDWLKTAKVIKKAGFRFKRVDVNTIKITETREVKKVINIHKALKSDVFKPECLKYVFERAKKQEVYGVQTLVPCFEDLFFINLVEMANNLRYKTNQKDILFALFDCNYLITSKNNFNWDIVREDAKKAGVEIQLNFAIKFFDKITQDTISNDVRKSLLFEREVNDYSRVVLFKRFYYTDLQKECRAMKIADVVQKPKMWGKYIKLKARYKFLKLIGSHPRLLEWCVKDLDTKIYGCTQ